MPKKIIYGCMRLGGGWNTNPITSDDIKKTQEIIETALEVGINTFDHADIYTHGKAEQVFGSVLKQKPELRDKIILQSKTGIVLGKGPNHYNSSKDYIKSQVNIILKRLNTNYLDQLLIHRPDALMKGQEIAETFSELQNEGLVKHFGVSNMSVSQIELIRHFWKEPLIANQIQLSLGHTSILDMTSDVNTKNNHNSGIQGILEYCQINNLTIQAWSPIDRGRYLKDIDEVKEEDKALARKLIELGNKYQVSPNVISLAWLFKLPVNIEPIVGSTNIDRIKDSVKSLDIELTHEEWYELWITSRSRLLP